MYLFLFFLFFKDITMSIATIHTMTGFEKLGKAMAELHGLLRNHADVCYSVFSRNIMTPSFRMEYSHSVVTLEIDTDGQGRLICHLVPDEVREALQRVARRCGLTYENRIE